MPKDVTEEQMATVLKEIPLPNAKAEPAENWVSWVTNALAEFQKRGWAEAFEIPEFLDHGAERARQWWIHDFPYSVAKENYTQRLL